MSLIKDVIAAAKANYQRVMSGQDINIPFPFQKFSKYVPGIQQKRYYIVTANAKVGKTQITDFLFLYHPYQYLKTRKSNIKIKVVYFTLEMSAEEKVKQALCHFLFVRSEGRIRVSPEQFDSQFGAISPSILKEAETLVEEFENEFEPKVEFIDKIRNPFGIYSHMREYARKNGKFYNNGQLVEIPEKAEWENYKWNKYVPNDPDEYVIIILDHANLIKAERGNDLFNSIGDLSKYFVNLRNYYGYIPVLIQQQALSQESVENLKADRLRPSADGLNMNKQTSQDCDMLLGLFSPYRHKFPTYQEYILAGKTPEEGLRDNHRELSVIYNRRGSAVAVQLFFDGVVNWFEELPPIKSAMLDTLYEVLKERRLKKKSSG